MSSVAGRLCCRFRGCSLPSTPFYAAYWMRPPVRGHGQPQPDVHNRLQHAQVLQSSAAHLTASRLHAP